MCEKYLKSLNDDRIWRVRELSDLRNVFNSISDNRSLILTSRSVAVFSYAHWEGYCTDCCNVFINFLESKNYKYSDLPSKFLLGAARSSLDSYRNKSDNMKNRFEIIRALSENEKKDFVNFDRSIILPRSNLNFEKLLFIFSVIDADIEPFQKHRLKIDNELVGWRHLVAHGEMFVLDNEKVLSHTHFCEELMFLMKDAFEELLYAY